MKFLSPTIALFTLFISVSATASVVEISQKGRSFQPGEVTIKVGDILRIHNDDEFLHHVYVKSPDFNFDSMGQPPGKTVEISFPRTGDYRVQCDIHPKMKLDVHVQ